MNFTIQRNSSHWVAIPVILTIRSGDVDHPLGGWAEFSL
jgi:hypothetical protein